MPRTDHLPTRSRDGRFTGNAARPAAAPAPATDFTDAADLSHTMREILEQGLAHIDAFDPDSGEPAPAFICKASPGAGKSRGMRDLVATTHQFAGDQLWIAPTLDLTDEAVAHSRSIGVEAFGFRGRSAVNPQTGTPMCDKAELADKVARLGLPVSETLCRRKEKNGNTVFCPHYQTCAYQRQSANLPTTPVQRHMTTASITRPDPTQREAAIQVLDEKFWQELERRTDIALDQFIAPRIWFKQGRNRAKSANAAKHADLLKAAKDVVDALLDGRSPLTLNYSEADYRAFAACETENADTAPTFRPDEAEGAQEAALDAMKADLRHALRARRFARLWTVLAEAASQGRIASERLRLARVDDDRLILRVFGRAEIRSKAPKVILDADADPTILAAIGIRGKEHSLTLRPNAQVFQLSDRRMTNGTLLRTNGRIRASWVSIIRREVVIDRFGARGGVLVGATRKVVRRFFEDAGHDFTNMTDDEVSRYMLETELHGARWLWFGGRALGSNAYRDCSSVVIIGREELPLHALEDKARALFGDRPGEELTFIAPDDDGRQEAPLMPVGIEMRDGSAMEVDVPCHPDPLIRALQRQTRECATRQLVERLRLAHAPDRKRVILGCNIPIPGLPVDRLLSWEELCVYSTEAAVLEAFLKTGVLRLSASGLAEDAPGVFTSKDAAKSRKDSKLTRMSADGLWPEGLEIPVVPMQVKLARKSARMVSAIVQAECIEEALVIVDGAFGGLKDIEFSDQLPEELNEVRMPMRPSAWSVEEGMAQAA